MRNVVIACSLFVASTACSSTQNPAPSEDGQSTDTQSTDSAAAIAALLGEDSLGEPELATELAVRATTPAAFAPGTARAKAAIAAAEPYDPARYAQDEEFLQQEAENWLVLNQQKQVLVQFYLDKARELENLGQYEEAEIQIELAADLEPQNPDVRESLGHIQALLGKNAGEYQQIQKDLELATQIRSESLRASALENIEAAELAIARGDYERAIAEASLARDFVNWSQLGVDWQGIDTRADELLSRARSEREVALTEQRLAEEELTTQLLQEEELLATTQTQAKVNDLMRSGIAAFEAQQYETSRTFAERALRIDPRNEDAMDLSDASFKAGLERDNEDFIRRKRVRYQEWEQELQALQVPVTGVLNIDEDYWAQITEIRQPRTAIVGDGDLDALDSRLIRQLSETVVPGLVVEEEESLTVVIEQIRATTNLDILVDPPAEEAALSEGAIFDLRLTNAQPANQVLNLVTDLAGPDVVWSIEHGAVLITTRDKAAGQLILRHHDISDLTLTLPNFQAPRIDRLRLFEELEDDDGGGPFGGLDDASTQLESDTLEELVRNNVRPETWDEIEGVSLGLYNETTMIVRHSVDVQREVQAFLEDLRRFNSMMVTIDTRFLTVTDNYLQEIGVEWRGIDNPGAPFTDLDDFTSGLEDNSSLGFDNGGTGVDGGNQAGPPSAGFFFDDGEDGSFAGSTSNIFNDALGSALSTVGGFTAQWQILDDSQLSFILRAVESSSQIEVVNTQTLSVYNSQQAAVSVINQQAYVQDFDVEVATGISIADPVINVLTEGVSLQVTPTVHHDRQSLTLEVQPTVAQVIALTPFATNLANAIGSPVEFVLPELRVQSLKTTASIPDGGTILIGGLSSVLNVERRAEVPFLANIPLLGFFFKEEGYSNEKESLMILMKAWITDVREVVKRFE